MLKIPTNQLTPGMKVGQTIFTSEGITLIKGGVSLTKKAINRLKLLGVPSIYVENSFTADLEIDDVIQDTTRAEAVKAVRSIFDITKATEEASRPYVAFKEKDIVHVVEKILNELLSKKDVIVSLTDIRSYDDYTFAHSVNVCVLALLTGCGLGLSQSQLSQLGMGALLHDIGKVAIPDRVLNKPASLNLEELELMKKHPEMGYEILRRKSEIGNLAMAVVHEHHERINGSGYPRGLVEQEIHLYGQIVGLVDVYDALTADRVYRKAFLPHQAYEMLAGAGGNYFDYKIIKVFLDNIAIYPIGTFVQLGSGRIGVVIKVVKGLTHRPIVRVLFENKKTPIKAIDVDLAGDLRENIAKILTAQEVMLLKNKAVDFKSI